jgi:hypothetical protein
MSDPVDYRGEGVSERVHERDDERAFTRGDFKRALALIQAAGDEITTFREASLAFRGIREQLSIMTRVFATSVVIVIGCLGYLFITTNEIAKAVTRLDERLTGTEERFGERFDAVDKRFDAIDKRFDAIDKRLDGLTAAVERLQPPRKQSSLE